MTQFAMQLDAFCLFVIMVSTIAVAQEDRGLSWKARALALTVAAGCFVQAIWLLGIWQPNVVTGYPWGRVLLDAAFALASVNRAAEVVREANREKRIKRNCGKIKQPFSIAPH